MNASTSVADQNLVRVWPRFLDRKYMEGAPGSTASAQEIRDWFYDDARSGKALRSIRHLDLSSLGLTEIPPEVSRCQKLGVLILRDNALTRVTLLREEWPKLQYVHLEGNPLRKQPICGPLRVLQMPSIEEEYDFCEEFYDETF